ncbi:MAG: Arylsulfatase [Planctomycetes bacterium ADurb.Bin126]|nr:MAG: Arylsulfatase [Planctomycetes bacterium ADurb.Bin126]HOD81060.1 sulfatase [Phycisphaerae bacterium]HQL74837.1 sulfatase [Phycisphaerae bacterium]
MISRREFLSWVGAATGAAWVTGFRGARAENAPRRRPPNIVILFADDQGWKDAGYAGSDFYETPNLDRIAREGMSFTCAYSCAGNCAPSRACLISGQYTPRHGVYAVGSTDRGPKNLMRMIPIPNRQDLPPENVTLAEAMKAAGYATAMFGKWHLGGGTGPTSPSGQGFDTAMPTPTQGDADDPKRIYSITRAACEFIEKNKDRPFLAYVAHHAIHTAQQARKETLAKFKAKPGGKQHDKALYAACTYDMDDGVGIVLAKLRELGLEKDTLVIFTSDNGATPASSQEPLRGAKGAYYEGGIRVPMLAYWPGTIKPGTTCDTPVLNVDFYPTALAAAGAAPPADKTLDGESLLPLMKGEGKLRREAIFWHFPGYLNSPVPRGRDPVFRTRPVSVIHKGDWKLLLYHEEWVLDGGREKIDANNAVELYNLADDIGERTNLAATRKGKRDELLDDLLAWFKSTNALMPSKTNPDYNPAAGAGEKGKGAGKKNKKNH